MSDSTMISSTRVSQPILSKLFLQHQIDVKITGHHEVKKSMFETTRFYHIEVRADLEGFQTKDKPHKVERRFNDFK
jgi:hypothetical protein